MVPRFPFRHFKALGVEGEFAEQKRGVVGVGEAAVVAQGGYGSVGEFAVHHSQKVTHLGNGCLVLNHFTDLQPIL
jgi:hypothetical protein